MTKQDRLFGCLVQTMGPQSEVPTPTASLCDDLGFESLDKVEMVMNIEQEFGIQIDDDTADKITTWGELMKYVESIPKEASLEPVN